MSVRRNPLSTFGVYAGVDDLDQNLVYCRRWDGGVNYLDGARKAPPG